MKQIFCWAAVGWAVAAGATLPAQSIEADLLVAGGSEAAVAAAVQASRLGVGRVVLVNDIDRFGGQFSNEGVGPADERVLMKGRSVNFPRSGMMLEVVRAMRVHNLRTYGMEMPGNCWSGTDTIEPGPAARIFEDLLSPEVKAGRLRVFRGYAPETVHADGGRVTGVRFASASGGAPLEVRARLTVDATDWGDVIRLSGARYYAGVDPRGRFGEPSEPEEIGPTERQEMNPITWTMTLRETAEERPLAAPPPGYEPASYSRRDIWRDSGVYHETYQRDNPPTPYSQRRLVDRLHYGFPFGTEAIQLNSTGQDYPLCNLPPRVVSALERLEPGASRKNVVDMTPAQRQIVLDDAKAHTLGYLYFLQHDHPKAETRARMGTASGGAVRAARAGRARVRRRGARLGAVPSRRRCVLLPVPHRLPSHAALLRREGQTGRLARAPLRHARLERQDAPRVLPAARPRAGEGGRAAGGGAERGRLQHRAGGVPPPRADAPLRTGGRHTRRAGPVRGPRAARCGGGSRLRARCPPRARARRGRASGRRDHRLAGSDARRSPLRGGQPGAPSARCGKLLLLRPEIEEAGGRKDVGRKT